jgi:hypothetical protein
MSGWCRRPGLEVSLSVPSSVWNAIVGVSQARTVGVRRVEPVAVVFAAHGERAVFVVQLGVTWAAQPRVLCDVLDRLQAAGVHARLGLVGASRRGPFHAHLHYARLASARSAPTTPHAASSDGVDPVRNLAHGVEDRLG